MRIIRIRIENFRGVGAAEIRPSEGITIIHGPNEAGKSSMLEGMRLVLTEPAESGKKAFRDIVPWGTDLKARVELDLSPVDGNVYRIVKTFPKGEAHLAALEDGTAVPMAEGKAAHERLLRLLGMPEGAEELYRLLWIPQGETFSVLSEKPVGGSIAQWVRDAVRANMVSPRVERFYETLTEELQKTYTRTGKVSKGSRLATLKEKVGEAAEHAQAAAERAVRAETDRSEYTRLGEEIEKTETECRRAGRRVEALKRKQEAFERIRPLIEEHRRMERVYREIAETRRDLHDLAETLPDRIERKLAAARRRLEAIEERLSEQAALREEFSRVQSEIEECPVTDATVERRLNALGRRADEARIRLEAAGLTLTSRRLGSIPSATDDVNENESTGTGEPGNGPTFERKDEWKFEISTDEGPAVTYGIGDGAVHAGRNIVFIRPGEFEIVCTGPLSRQEMLELKERRSKAEEETRSILAGCGLDSTEAVGESLRRYRELEARLAELKTEIAGAERYVEGRATLGTMITGGEHERETVLRILRETGDGEAEKIAADRFSAATGAARGPNRQDSGTTSSSGEIDEIDITGLDRQVTRNIERLNAAASRLAELLDGADPDEYRGDYILRTASLEAESERVNGMEPADADAADPSVLTAAAKQSSALENGLTELRVRRATLEGRLQTAGDPWAEERHWSQKRDELSRELAQEEVRIESARLLVELMDTRKAELERNLAEPVSRRLTEAFSSVVGDGYSRVGLNQEFGFASIATSASTTVNPAELSYGTREQLAFLFRLTLAEYLSDREPQVLVLDDSLVNTDHERLEKIMAALLDSNGIQSMIFTCRPELFESLRGHALFVPMGADRA